MRAMWIKFNETAVWFPRSLKRAVHLQYAAGSIEFVPGDCALAMIEGGQARPATRIEIQGARDAKRQAS